MAIHREDTRLCLACIAASGFALLAMTREVCVHQSPHGEERRSRVSNHGRVQNALFLRPRPSRRMASAMLLRMRAHGLARCSTAGTVCREQSAWRSIFAMCALNRAWIAASGVALLAMTRFILVLFSPSSRALKAGGDPSLALIERCC